MKDLGVLKWPVVSGASVLVELDFISHPQVARAMATTSWAAQVAEGVVAGVSDYIKQQEAER